MYNEIPAVNADDLRKLWELWPHMQEQKAGGLSINDVHAMLSPDADFYSGVQHCAALKQDIERGKIVPENN